MAHPINVAFIWHFHQPYYKNNYSNEFLMPWARLHATKDYYFMPALVKNFPQIHCTFNISSSLLIQIEDYALNYDKEPLDKFYRLSKTEAAKLSLDDKIFIVNNFFNSCASSNNFFKKSRRLYSLFLRLSNAENISIMSEEEKAGLFSDQDILDIIVLSNLLWIDPLSIENDQFLFNLKKKDLNFTEKEKAIFINEKISEIINKIIPVFKELTDKGQIEISASPFYHPILPLLCDTSVANFSNPNIILPPKPFIHPEDADRQIKSSIDFFKDKLNCKIQGLWPSEGAVSEKVVSLVIKNKIKWIASDEDILGNSIGVDLNLPDNRRILYKPYVLKRGNDYVYIIFRDRRLSDQIGFKYSAYDPKDAASDLINNIKNIAISIGNDNKNGVGVVPIILDGENAWEYYENNALDFFNYLYEGISKEELINTVTVSEHLKPVEENLKITSSYEFEDIKWKSETGLPFEQVRNIPLIYPGSWINHNFNIWIGDEEDNKAWDLLLKTRNYLENYTKPVKDQQKLKNAWEQIYIAEGSDYNWWYGDDRTSGIDEQYDELYRIHLANVYEFLDEPVPDEYYIPIITSFQTVRPAFNIVSYINPSINGVVDNYFDWLGSAVYFPNIISGKAMAHTDRFIRSIHYGFNESNIFFRIDFFKKNIKHLTDKDLLIGFIEPEDYKIHNEFYKNTRMDWDVVSYLLNGRGNRYAINGCFKEVLELPLPVSSLNLKPLDIVQFFIILTFKENMLVEIERIPVSGYFEFAVPDKNFELSNWLV